MSGLARGPALERLRDGGTWDVVVIGGGATGLGAAVDSASRGYRTILLEATDFAHGTSSRSTKLIHGGVRYLAQGRFSLVRESLKERALLLQNAPQLVQTREFVVPAYQGWQLLYYGLGLRIYDHLAGKFGLDRSHKLSIESAIEKAPTLRPEGLKGGIVYIDGQFDDARLAITLARTLADLGGTALNAMAVVGFELRGGRIAGVRALDSETGIEYRVDGKVVINATGVFADAVRRLDDPEANSLITPSQGAHLVLDRTFLPGDTAVMIPKTDDGRVLFAIPWHGRVILGTTDTKVGGVTQEPRPLSVEISYLLDHAGRYFTEAPRPVDILSMFAGLRPLLGRINGAERTSRISREHAVVVSDSGLVTITGGKWTTYRRMASDVVDRAARVGGLTPRPCKTSDLRLHGWQSAGTSIGCWPHLAVHGSDVPEVAELIRGDPGMERLLHPSLPYLAGEVIWAARHEAARTVEDVLARRTRALLLNANASIEAAPFVASLMASELEKDSAWQEAQITAFRRIAGGFAISV